ncbi:hypothetical protein GCM10023238_35340 [Streptomyces heliomycini]
MKVDIFEEQVPRGRKGSDSPKRDRRADRHLPTRADFIEFSTRSEKPVVEISTAPELRPTTPRPSEAAYVVRPTSRPSARREL